MMSLLYRIAKEGWQSAFRKLITYLYDGEMPKWDFSKIRPKGCKA